MRLMKSCCSSWTVSHSLELLRRTGISGFRLKVFEVKEGLSYRLFRYWVARKLEVGY